MHPSTFRTSPRIRESPSFYSKREKTQASMDHFSLKMLQPAKRVSRINDKAEVKELRRSIAISASPVKNSSFNLDDFSMRGQIGRYHIAHDMIGVMFRGGSLRTSIFSTD
jgi:hypothetical protein